MATPRSQDPWASDVPISRPEPPPSDVPVQVGFGAFGFSMNGMVHDVSAAQLEEMFTPHFAPEGFIGEFTERLDAPIDADPPEPS